MRIFCTIMLILFLIGSIAMTAGCIVEWQGRCSSCETPHEELCNVLIRSRLYSIIGTMVFWVCAFLWMALLVDEIKKENMSYTEYKVRGNYDYKTTMRNSVEKRL